MSPDTQQPVLSLEYILRRSEKNTQNTPVIIFLHGHGSNEADIFGLATIVPPEYLVISARGPITLGEGQYAWYPLDWSSGAPVGTPRDTAVSRTQIKKFIDEAVGAFPVDPKRIFLLGFSQGAVMSYAVSLTHPDLIKGVVALSGRILEETKLEIGNNQAVHTRFFVGHGTQDQVLPIAHGRSAKKYLEALGVALEYHEYVALHTITPVEASAVRAWIRGQGE